ncbi:MAG: hypothetical protein Q7U48_13630 [Hydrogenophaga sp.]|nr:hypothetical protein [Hydrogenophaga sp.]
MLTPSEIEKMWDAARFVGGGESPHKAFAAAVETAATATLLERIAELERTKNDCGAGAGCCYQAAKIEELERQLAQPVGDPVAYVTGYFGGRFVVQPINPAAVLPTCMGLYAYPAHGKDAP